MEKPANSFLVIGGCRSGKSSYALERCNQISGRKIYIATTVVQDEEMHQRVAAHQQERGKGWQTIEEPLQVHQHIETRSKTAAVILVDCLTLWVSNMLMETYEQDRVLTMVEHLTQAVQHSQCPVFLVSNEVGTGIVPENKLARRFRDNAGLVNQKVAAAVDEVYYTVAGIPMRIKPSQDLSGAMHVRGEVGL